MRANRPGLFWTLFEMSAGKRRLSAAVRCPGGHLCKCSGQIPSFDSRVQAYSSYFVPQGCVPTLQSGKQLPGVSQHSRWNHVYRFSKNHKLKCAVDWVVTFLEDHKALIKRLCAARRFV